jgi:hypothetical protein
MGVQLMVRFIFMMVRWMSVVPEGDEVSTGSLVMNDGKVVCFSRAMDTATDTGKTTEQLSQADNCFTATGTLETAGSPSVESNAASTVRPPASLLSDHKKHEHSGTDDEDAKHWPFQLQGFEHC